MIIFHTAVCLAIIPWATLEIWTFIISWRDPQLVQKVSILRSKFCTSVKPSPAPAAAQLRGRSLENWCRSEAVTRLKHYGNVERTYWRAGVIFTAIKTVQQRSRLLGKWLNILKRLENKIIIANKEGIPSVNCCLKKVGLAGCSVSVGYSE